MKFLIYNLFFFLLSINLRAQELSASVAYTGFHSPEISKILQAYNFSRPFLFSKQPLFRHGVSAGSTFLTKSSTPFKQGLRITYTFFSSYAKNHSLTNRFNFHFLSLNYLAQWHNPLGLKQVFTEASAGLTTSALFRRVNNEAFMIDDKRAFAFGLGLNLSITLGYVIARHSVPFVSPLFTMQYVPLMFAPGNEKIINGTSTLISSSRCSLLTFSIGCAIYLNKRFVKNNPDPITTQ